MKYIYFYFLLLTFTLVIIRNLAAADYSDYTPKDFDSFVQEAKDSASLSFEISDSKGTLLVDTKKLAESYPNHKSHFRLAEERLIPFHVINHKNKTMLTDIYVPYCLLLSQRPLRLNVFQIISSGELISEQTQDFVISLTRELQLRINHKIELEQLTIELNTYKTFKAFAEDLNKKNEDLALELSRTPMKINELEVTCAVLRHINKEQRTEARSLQFSMQENLMTVILQRNILLLCLISLLSAIGWYLYTETAAKKD